MDGYKFSIAITPCDKCDLPMVIVNAWVDDGRGIIEARCLGCDNTVLVEAVAKEVDPAWVAAKKKADSYRYPTWSEEIMWDQL